MRRKDAVKLSPLGYAKIESERGLLYATAGGFFLVNGETLKSVVLPPEAAETWEPVMPEATQEEPTSAKASAQAGPEDTQSPVMAQPKVGPERWADNAELDPGKVVVHRPKRNRGEAFDTVQKPM